MHVFIQSYNLPNKGLPCERQINFNPEFFNLKILLHFLKNSHEFIFLNIYLIHKYTYLENKTITLLVIFFLKTFRNDY